mmetsp:Transcript_45879/g.53054  ORF Transcript_45879/g.53054 Transcript_45879/m.53054 type:complete len:80 (-) Transcript_45879:36-275(-)
MLCLAATLLQMFEVESSACPLNTHTHTHTPTQLSHKNTSNTKEKHTTNKKNRKMQIGEMGRGLFRLRFVLVPSQPVVVR